MPAYDLEDFLADDALLLKGVVSEKHPKGHTYKIKSPSAATGLQLRKVMQMWDAQGDEASAPTAEDIANLLALVTDGDGAPVELPVKLMGAVYRQMIDDGVSADRLELIVSLVAVHYGRGAQVAVQMVGAAGAKPGEAPAPNRATRRTQQKKAGSNSRQASTGTRGRTRNPASTRSSTSPTAPEVQAKAV